MKTANQYANECAADAFLVHMEERYGIDRAMQNNGMEVMGQSKDSVNIVEKIPAGATSRQEMRRSRNNVEHYRHRTAKKRNRNINISSDSNILKPLRLIMGRDQVPTQDDTQLNGQNIAWAHRTILGLATRAFQ